MSSVLNRKKKKSENRFFSDNETVSMLEHDSNVILVRRTYHTIEKIGYYILRWKYGFSIKRLQKFQNGIVGCVVAYEEGRQSNKNYMRDMRNVMNKELDMNIEVEAGKIPFRTKIKVARCKYPATKYEIETKRGLINGAFENWYTQACYVLKFVFNWKPDRVKEFLNYCYEFMEDYAMGGLIDDSDIDSGIEETIFEETKFKIGA